MHRGLLGLLLTGTLLWLGYAAFLSREVLLIAESLIALAAWFAVLRRSRWVRYPVILLALLISAEWLTAFVLSVRIGYFAHLSAGGVYETLWPGILIEGAALYACIIAVTCYRRHVASPS